MRKQIGKKVISLLLVMAFIVGLLPMNVKAAEIEGGDFNPVTKDTTVDFRFDLTQRANIELWVDGVYRDNLATDYEITGSTGTITPLEPCSSANYESARAINPSKLSNVTLSEIQADDGSGGTETHVLLKWDGRINGLPVIGTDDTKDECVIQIKIVPLGYPEKNIDCDDVDDGAGGTTHVPGENWTWTHRPDWVISTAIYVDYKGSGDGSIPAGSFLMVKGGTSYQITCDAPEVFAGNSALKFKFAAYMNKNSIASVTVGDPVNMVDGNYTFNYTDLCLEGSIPLTFMRVYSSLDKGGSLGQGFTHSYEYSLLNDAGLVRVTLPYGEEVRFITKSAGVYRPLQDQGFTLVDNSGGYIMIHEEGAKFYFSAAGKLTSVVNPNGVTVATLSYTGDELTTIAGPAGTYTLAWSGVHIASVTDNAGRKVEYTYSGDKLTAVKNPDGDELTYSYDTNGYLNSAMDFEGEEYIRNTYDANGRVTKQEFKNADVWTTSTMSYDDVNRVNTFTETTGRVTKYYYDEHRSISAVTDADGSYSNNYSNSRATSAKDALGNITSYDLDSSGRVSMVHYADGNTVGMTYVSGSLIDTVTYSDTSTEKYTYDAGGNVESYKDRNGNIFSYTYNALELVTKGTDALGNATDFTYDIDGRLLSATDAEGGMVSNTYDAVGRIATSTTKLNATQNAVTKYEYSPAGKLLKVTDALNNETTYTYNANGFTTSTTDALSGVTSTVYGTNGQPLSTTDAMNNTTTYAYNADGLIESVTDPMGNETTYEYNDEGQLTKTTDASNNATNYEYDSLDRLVKTTDALGNTKSYTYDSMGRTSTFTDENNSTTTYTYNLLGRLTKTTDALGNATNYTYDPNGNLLTTTDANGVVTSSEYNALNYTVKAIDGEGKATLYEYDKVGRLTKTTDALGNVASYTYDLAGNMLTTTDPNGNVTSYTYDLLSRQTRQTNADGTYSRTVYDALGRVMESYDELSGRTSYTYNKNGNVLTMTDPKGNVTTSAYNAINQITSVTYADTGVVSYTYTPMGSVLSTTDQLSNVTAYTYDVLGRAKTVTDAAAGVTEYFYDPVGNVIKTTKDGHTFGERVFDAVNRVTTDKDALGNLTSYTYDKTGNILTVTDKESHTTTYTYNKNYQVTQTADAMGFTQKTEYDELGRAVKTTDQNGNATNYTYDANGNVLTTTDALSGVVTTTYDNMNRILTTEDKLVAVTTFAYDTDGRVKTITDALSKTITYVYDANSNLSQLTNRENEKTSYTYDCMNRQVKETNGLNHSTETVYDLAGNITKTLDGNKNATTYTYDPLNRLLTKTDPEGSVESYTYNYLDKAASYTANGSTTSYAYDLNGNLTSETSPLGYVTSYTYDKMGNVVSKTDENSKTTAYVYDVLYRLSTRTDVDGTANYTYDKNGNMLTAADSVGTVIFVYDKLDRTTSVTDTDGKTVGYTFDANGNRLTTVYPDSKAVTNSYDTLGRVATLTDYDGTGMTYTRDAEGKVTKAAYSDGSTTEYDYNAAGLMIQQKEVDKSNATRREIIYGYDDEGNLKSEQRTGVDVTKKDESVRYYYDKANKLTSTVIEGVTTTNTYDVSGNLTSDGKNTYTYDKQNRLLTKTGTDGTTTYSYDAAGNLLKKTAPDGATTYTYNAQNRLVKGEKSDGESSAYTYNALGVRTKNVQVRENVNAGYGSDGSKSMFGEDYTDYLDDGRATDQPTWVDEVGLVHQNATETVTKHYTVDYLSTANRDIMVTADGQYTQRYVYDENGTRISAEFGYADNTHPGEGGENPASDIAVNSVDKVWYRTSLLGSTLFAVDENGDVVSHTIYDPWGNPLTDTATDMNQSALDNRNNYTGYTWDETLELYFAQNRFYDAATHRFTQEDPVKDSSNWYVYCGNNPMTRTDPNGLFNSSTILRQGDYSEDVKALKTALRYQWNYTNVMVSITVDGKDKFDSFTESAVRDFQSKHSLTVDGLVGEKTWKSLGLKFTGGTISTYVDPYPTSTGKLTYKSNVYYIYVPRVIANDSTGNNSNYCPSGYSKAEESVNKSWNTFNIWGAIVGGGDSATDLVDANTDKGKKLLAVAGVSDWLQNAAENVTHFVARIHFFSKGNRGKTLSRKAVIEFGITDLQGKHGTSYYFLPFGGCLDQNVIDARKALGASFGVDGQANILLSMDAARKTDPYFFYVYVDSSGTWHARLKKYAGDNAFAYFYGSETTCDLRNYDKNYIVDSTIKKNIISKFAEAKVFF